MRKWLLTARLALPKPLKRAARLVRAAARPVPASPALPQALLDECRFVADRQQMLDRLPKGGIVAELGVLHGAFSRQILRRVGPERLHLFDLTFERTAKDVLDDPRVVAHAGGLPDSLSVLPPESCDWIYVDADHAYAGVRRDAAAAAAKVKPGGFLVFNDFALVDPSFGQYGVHRAVCEFAIEHQWRFVWFAFERNGLYDVALRKPTR
jgi:hypothetical protein